VTPTAHWLEYMDWAVPIVAEPIQVKDGYARFPTPGQRHHLERRRGEALRRRVNGGLSARAWTPLHGLAHAVEHAGSAFEGAPQLNGGCGSYSMLSCIPLAVSSPAIFATRVRAMSMPRTRRPR